jgi:hypothetical protein
MKQAVLLLLAAVGAFAADDSWAKVQELKNGAELRIYKVNEQAPVVAKLDRAGEESLIVVTKNEQVSIPKEEIDRIDCRTAQPERQVEKTRVNRKVVPKGAEVTSNTVPGATTTVTTGLKIPSKPSFETVYRRTPADK